MVPKLRKRVWYQRFLDRDTITAASYKVFRQNTYTTDWRKRSYAVHSATRKYRSSKRCWIRPQSRYSSRYSSHDSASVCSNFSDDEIGCKEIKVEPKDEEEFPKRQLPLLEDTVGKGQGRMLMREWLEVNADCGGMSGLKWLDKDHGLIQIAWKHGSRAGWNRSDVEVFENWALHTGKFNSNKSDCKRWKANFRCALNSLPDVIEIKERCNTRCRNPYKVYRLLPPDKKTRHLKSKRPKPDRYIQQDLSSNFADTGIRVKEEPMDEADCDKRNTEIYGDAKELIPSTPNYGSPSPDKKSTATELSTASRDPVSRHLTAGVVPCDSVNPTPWGKIKMSPETKESYCLRHNDHNYAYINEHLMNQELDIIDYPDLISAINDEFAKFCSGTIDLDLWSDDNVIAEELYPNSFDYFDELS